MTRYAFNDGGDGYYEVDVPDGEDMPAWAADLTSCALQPAAPVPSVQIVVSPRQIRHAINSLGLRAAVEAGVGASNQDVKDWWEFSTAIEENHPAIIAMCVSLGITDSQRHDIFVLAASL